MFKLKMEMRYTVGNGKIIQNRKEQNETFRLKITKVT